MVSGHKICLLELIKIILPPHALGSLYLCYLNPGSSIMQEILTLTDIQLLVNRFYDKVRTDDLLGPIFKGVIQDNWDQHLNKMYRFWQTVLLKEPTYMGAPFPPHAKLPVDQTHFDRWMALFTETIDTHFTGEKAAEAKWRAEKMATMFLSKIQYYQSRGTQPLR